MKTLADRLAFALKQRGTSPAELARATKKTESAVSQWLSGETKSMRSDSLMATCSLLSCNAQWLATGKGASGLEGNSANSNLPIVEAFQAYAATPGDKKSVVTDMRRPQTLAQTLECLSGFLTQMNASDRRVAMTLIAGLELEPERHAKVAAGILAMTDLGNPALREERLANSTNSNAG